MSDLLDDPAANAEKIGYEHARSVIARDERPFPPELRQPFLDGLAAQAADGQLRAEEIDAAIFSFMKGMQLSFSEHLHEDEHDYDTWVLVAAELASIVGMYVDLISRVPGVTTAAGVEGA